jgi:hypothetical protein
VADEVDAARVLSGQSGIVTGRRARLRARLADALDDTVAWARREGARIDSATARPAGERGEVLVLGVYAPDHADSMARSVRELRTSSRSLHVALAALCEATAALRSDTVLTARRGHGKFANLNALLERVPAARADWVLVVDDDVELPRGFLDRFLAVAERLRFDLAQPALRHASHAAWPHLRRARGTVARRTAMVEIGPVTAFGPAAAAELLPFPPLEMGWGLDSHWGALAQQRGWRLGVIDATPIRHRSRETASTYDRAAAVRELQAFLRDRPHLDRDGATEVLERHRSLPPPSREPAR